MLFDATLEGEFQQGGANSAHWQTRRPRDLVDGDRGGTQGGQDTARRHFGGGEVGRRQRIDLGSIGGNVDGRTSLRPAFGVPKR